MHCETKKKKPFDHDEFFVVDYCMTRSMLENVNGLYIHKFNSRIENWTYVQLNSEAIAAKMGENSSNQNCINDKFWMNVRHFGDDAILIRLYADRSENPRNIIAWRWFILVWNGNTLWFLLGEWISPSTCIRSLEGRRAPIVCHVLNFRTQLNRETEQCATNANWSLNSMPNSFILF